MSLIGATHGFHIFKNSRKTPLKFEHHSRFLIASFHRARGQENPLATETYAPLPIAPYLARMVNERPDRGPIIFQDLFFNSQTNQVVRHDSSMFYAGHAHARGMRAARLLTH